MSDDAIRDRHDVDANLREIVERYGPFLRRTVRRLCPERLGIDPDEVEQQALLRLWRALERETDLSQPASYLYRIVSSATVDAIRAVRRRQEVPLEQDNDRMDDPPANRPEPASEQPGPDRLLDASETGAAVRAALARLTTNRRRAVTLHLDGFSHRDAAALLGWSEAKVRNLVWRGLHDLRTELRREGYTL